MPCISCSPNHTVSPMIVPVQNRTFVLINKAPWMYHCHPKSLVYLGNHSCCCTFRGCRQMHDDSTQHTVEQNSVTALNALQAPPIKIIFHLGIGRIFFFISLVTAACHFVLCIALQRGKANKVSSGVLQILKLPQTRAVQQSFVKWCKCNSVQNSCHYPFEVGSVF